MNFYAVGLPIRLLMFVWAVSNILEEQLAGYYETFLHFHPEVLGYPEIRIGDLFDNPYRLLEAMGVEDPHDSGVDSDHIV